MEGEEKMERVRKYRSKNGAEYELVQTKAPTKAPKKKKGEGKKEKGGSLGKEKLPAPKRKSGKAAKKGSKKSSGVKEK